MTTDDPRLTAYALGELDPPEQAEIEALLQTDPEAAREVDEIRATAAHFRTQLATETAPALAPEQQRDILAIAERREEKIVPIARRRRVWAPIALAACAAFVVAGYSLLYNESKKPHQRLAEVGMSAPEGLNAPSAEGLPIAFEPAPATPFPMPPATPMAQSPLISPTVDAIVSSTNAVAFNGRVDRDVDMAKKMNEAVDQPQERLAGHGSMVSGVVAPSAAPAAPRMAEPVSTRGVAALGKAKAMLAPAAATPAATTLSSTGAGTLVLGGTTSYSGATVVNGGGLVVNELQRRPSVPPVVSAPQPSMKPGAALADTSSVTSPANPEGRSQLGVAGFVGGYAKATTSRTKNTGAADAKESKIELAQNIHPFAEYEKREAPAPAPTKPSAATATKAVNGFSEYSLAPEQPNTESYDLVTDNAFLPAAGNPLSTFSIDVDTASYSNVRRFLTAGQRPPKGAVRIEELVNYFSYDYAKPKEGEPFSVNMEVAACPWTPEHRLLRIGLKARELDPETRPQANLVFLIDVSGSMMPENRLPLVKQSLRLLVDQLGPQDTVAIAVYAGASGTVLEPTNDKEKIRAALDRLQAGGSTNGAAGIRLAYDLAKKRFEKGKTNRVILATDGDFNVGVTNQSDLTDLIKAKAKSGVYLTVLGVGYGNLKDSTMENLADKGNGNYAYLDSIAEGRKVLVEQMSGTLYTVAKDVKMQIEFNPALVAAYRLIGYENRMLAKEDFNDDTKDAGEIGAGHTVTALYEVVPAGLTFPDASKTTAVDPLKYQYPAVSSAPPAAKAGEAQKDQAGAAAAPAAELLTLKLRWKAPDGDVSTKREFPLTDSGLTWERSSRDFRWAAAVASFGMLLRDSPYKGEASWSSTRELAIEGQGEKADGHRIEFLELIEKAEAAAK